MRRKKGKEPSPYALYWKRKAKKVFMRQFHYLPCEICGDRTGTVGHHLLPQGSNIDYVFEKKNIVVLCPKHHNFSNEIAAHSTNALAVEAFLDWLKEHKAWQYEWMKEHRNKRSGKRVNFRDLYFRLLDEQDGDAKPLPCSTKRVSIDSFVKTALSSSATKTT